MHLLGRLLDLELRLPRDGEHRLDEALPRWSLAGNAEWVVEAARQGETFRQISYAASGSMLAWELEILRQEGYVRFGPFWLPSKWCTSHDDYVRGLRTIVDAVTRAPQGDSNDSNDSVREKVFEPKVQSEFEPFLALWPSVIVVPTAATLTIDDLIFGRAFPIHPLGITPQTSWADGHRCTPAEFLFHDLDHARFKVREDLLALGIEISDAYRDGSSFDSTTGRHRTFLAEAQGKIGGALWQAVGTRARLAQSLLLAIASEPQKELGEAARWLLFELVHEKSLPMDPRTLARALATDTHSSKLAAKCEGGFYADQGPSAIVVARLDEARGWLANRLIEEDS